MIVDMKTIQNSRTVWFNLIVLIVALLAMPEFISVIPETYLPFAVLIGGFGNLVLRIYFTEKPIE